jgi:hypothetical protein
VRDLFIVMLVQGHDASFLEQHAGNHDLIANHKLPVKERVQSFPGQFIPANVFDPA